MSDSLSTSTAILDRPRTDDDRLHHICAVHDYQTDHAGLCEAGVGCRSLCGRDLTEVAYSGSALPGEQECVVCAQMDEED